jgi:hypothetical protein
MANSLAGAVMQAAGIVLVGLVLLGFIIRYFGGQHAHQRYNHGLWQMATHLVRQVFHGVGWTLRRHWQFWLGMGIMFALIVFLLPYLE